MKKILFFLFPTLFFISGCYSISTPNQNIANNPIATSTKTNITTTTPVASSKKIALTFDDGPYGTSTSKILDILEKNNVPATFFLIGKNVEKFPEQARRILADGFVIGNHSYDHAKNLAQLSSANFESNLNQAEKAIENATGFHAVYFRPPYGSLSDTMKTVLNQNGYKTKLWNIDPEDWDYENSPADVVVERVLKNAKANSIILMHDGRDTKVDYPRDNTISALPVIIDSLRKKGFSFVTLDELEKNSSAKDDLLKNTKNK
jgi:peptidoglycan/xylan/chitin deacetylase (PgdA/CDA1 family)